MLYGDSSSNAGPSKDDVNRSFVAPGTCEGGSSKAEPSHWCLVTRESGVMEVRGCDAAAAVTLVSPMCESACVCPDLPAPRLEAGVPGEELPGGPAGVGGQLLGPVGNAGGQGGQKGGGDAPGRDPSGQRGDAGVAGVQPQQTVPAGEFHL